MSGATRAGRKELHFKTTAAWRKWLAQNCASETEVWLVFFRKSSGKPTLDYDPAVEEALCFGWIDSIIRKIDETKYARKFTPRKDDSNWSESNKRRVAHLVESKRMTEVGLAKVKAAKRNGNWSGSKRPVASAQAPPELKSALDENPVAKENFEALAPSYRKRFTGWIMAAKRPETRQKRVEESIQLLAKGRKLGMK